MAALKRLAAVYMLLVAVAVVALFLAGQFYDPTLEGAAIAVWQILDPLMVVGMVIVLTVAIGRKHRMDTASADQSAHQGSLETNLVFYYSVALFLALLWNWFGFQFVDPANDNGLLWTLIDTTLPLLLASTALRLWREAS